MRPHLGKMRPIWAICRKSSQSCSRIWRGGGGDQSWHGFETLFFICNHIHSESCQRLFQSFCTPATEVVMLFHWNVSRHLFLRQVINLDVLHFTGFNLEYLGFFLCLMRAKQWEPVLAWPTSCKGFICPESRNKLCGIQIHFKSVEDTEIWASKVTISMLKFQVVTLRISGKQSKYFNDD